MTDDYPERPETENLELPLLSDADPEDFEDIWGEALDELLIERLDTLLGGGEGELDVTSVDTEQAGIAGEDGSFVWETARDGEDDVLELVYKPD